ncbi:MAG TPA: hypothetical protein VGV59_16440 [Pyrinomonadaceae bacterium]|nr:hypothetical protein [Pyrinomonadaceae bacterium]
MKNLIRSATSLALATMMIALTILALPQLSNSATAAAQDRGPAPQSNQVDKGTKVLKGESVKAYVQQLRLKDKALNRALKDMERWGKLPNWESSAIIREAPKSRQETASVNFLRASFGQEQYWSDGSGNEMIIITAYGSESHWDGTVYTYEASTGQTYTYNGIVDDLVSSDPETSDVVDELYYPPDGSSPIREGGNDCSSGMYQCFDTFSSGSHKSTPGQADITNASANMTAKPVGFVGWFKRYFRCIKRCMAMATQFCFQKYPTNFRNFFVCLAIGGTAASITCAFNTRACGG